MVSGSVFEIKIWRTDMSGKIRVAALLLGAVMLFASCGTAAGNSTDSKDETKPAVSEEEKSEQGQAENNDSGEVSGMERFNSIITEMPPKGYDEPKEGVTYPTVTKYTYYSSTAERDTNVNVLLPADYSEDKEYPVLYLLHGYYDNEDWMPTKTSIDVILGNLIADGEAEEMIIVMPYIFCSKEMPTVTGMDDKNSAAYDNFINDLTTDLMPYIEENFSVAKGRENTAITGFSMGGREALFIGCNHPEIFGYIGAVCPAPGLIGQMDGADMKFADDVKPYVLLISSSMADGVVTSFPDSYRAQFDQNGEFFLSHVMTSTAHDPSSVKPHLYNYLRMLFKD